MPPQSNAVPGVDWAMSLTAGGTTGAEMFPAKFTFDINAAPSCANDYVVFNTSLTNPSIVAFNQLYSTQGSVGGLCNQNGPSVMWSYNTKPAGDTTGTVVTSAVLSGDGTKVAYVETRTAGNGGAILHVLKWKAGQGTIASPVAPDTTLTGGAAWSTCPAGNSCLVNITFNLGQPDTNSSPFYVFAFDILYVGDNNGVLHKFTGVFNGTPAEVTTGWPITVHSGTVLSSPVVDSGSGNIFVGDAGGRISYVREVGSTAGSCSSGSPPCLGSTNIALGGSIVDGPIVDSTTGRVFWFAGQTTSTTGQVVQTDTALGNSRTITFTNNGTTPLVSNFHTGAFDNAYLTSASPSITGFLYIVARTNVNRDHPALFRIGFSGTGVMNTTPDGGAGAFLNLVSSDGEDGSPVTELNNGSTDRIFFGVANHANAAGCPAGAGCIMSLTLGGAWPPAAVTNAVNASGGTSGIIVDNVSGSSQASSLYFTYRSNSTATISCNGTSGVGCAVKLTQSGLL